MHDFTFSRTAKTAQTQSYQGFVRFHTGAQNVNGEHFVLVSQDFGHFTDQSNANKKDHEITLMVLIRQKPSELNKDNVGKECDEEDLMWRRASHRMPPKNIRFHRRICRSSPRSISTAKLKVSPLLHTQPINHVVFMGSYLITQWDILS